VTPVRRAARSGGKQASKRVTLEQPNISANKITQYGYVENMNLHGADIKLPPEIYRLTYLLDREPQCGVLKDYLNANPLRTGPVCAIVVGTDYDMPDMAGMALLHFVEKEVLSKQQKMAFKPVLGPLCVEWGQHFNHPDAIWREIAAKYLSLPSLMDPKDIRSALGSVSGSIAFGFELYVDDWEDNKETLLAWLDDLRRCQGPPSGLAMAVIILWSEPSQCIALQALHAEVEKTYAGDQNVLVLPILGTVGFRDVRKWRGEFQRLAGDDIEQGAIQNIVAEIFGEDDQKSFRMNEVWKLIYAGVRRAWAPQ
jgi:hypothetical protein